MANEYGEPSPDPALRYNYPPIEPDAAEQTQTMPAALEELPPVGGPSAYAPGPPMPPVPSTVPPVPVPPSYGPSPTPPPYGHAPVPPNYAPQQPAYEPAAPSPTELPDRHTAVYPPVEAYGQATGGYGQGTPTPSYGAPSPGYGSDRYAESEPPSAQYPPSQYPTAQYPANQYPPTQYPPGQYESEYGQGGPNQGGYGSASDYSRTDSWGTATSAAGAGYAAESYSGYQPGAYADPAATDQGYGYGQAAQYAQPDPGQYRDRAPAGGAASSRSQAASRKSHVGLWTLLVVVVVVALIAGITFIVKPSFLFKKVLDHTAVERTIEQQSSTSATPLTDVSCPANEKVKAGVTFQCTAANNKKVTVTIKDSKANYEWSPSS